MKALDLPKKVEPLVRQGKRYKVIRGGRGSGKSWSVARIFVNIARHKPARFLCTREIQRTIQESVHYLLTDQIRALGYEDFFTITDTSIKGRNGSEFIFAGLRTQDITKLKSLEAIDYCWVEEGQVVSDKSWEILVPTIRKEGSEIWVTFNPELETDPTYERFVSSPPPDCLSILMNWRDNPWFPDVLEKERLTAFERDETEGKVKYNNIWEGRPLPAVEGAIFANEIAKVQDEGRIMPLSFNERLKVHCVWDLGWNDKMCIIFVQRQASSLMVVDYLEDSHRTYASYIKEMESKPYRYGYDFMPHDAGHRDPKYGKSHMDVMRELGRRPKEVPNIGVEAGIDVARETFPNVYFSDSKSVERLIHCLRRYRRNIPQTTNEAAKPLHDEFSHGADAFRYMAISAEDMRNEVQVSDPYKGLRGHGWAA